MSFGILDILRRGYANLAISWTGTGGSDSIDTFYNYRKRVQVHPLMSYVLFRCSLLMTLFRRVAFGWSRHDLPRYPRR